MFASAQPQQSSTALIAGLTAVKKKDKSKVGDDLISELLMSFIKYSWFFAHKKFKTGPELPEDIIIDLNPAAMQNFIDRYITGKYKTPLRKLLDEIHAVIAVVTRPLSHIIESDSFHADLVYEMDFFNKFNSSVMQADLTRGASAMAFRAFNAHITGFQLALTKVLSVYGNQKSALELQFTQQQLSVMRQVTAQSLAVLNFHSEVCKQSEAELKIKIQQREQVIVALSYQLTLSDEHSFDLDEMKMRIRSLNELLLDQNADIEAVTSYALKKETEVKRLYDVVSTNNMIIQIKNETIEVKDETVAVLHEKLQAYQDTLDTLKVAGIVVAAVGVGVMFFRGCKPASVTELGKAITSVFRP